MFRRPARLGMRVLGRHLLLPRGSTSFSPGGLLVHLAGTACAAAPSCGHSRNYWVKPLTSQCLHAGGRGVSAGPGFLHEVGF